MTRKNRLIAACLIAGTLLIIATLIYLNHRSATVPTVQFQQVRHYQGITEYKFEPNGLTVLLMPDPSATAMTVNMTYLVGSRFEQTGQTGMAHLLEHMVFRSTTHFKNVLAEFSKRGLSANGATTADSTSYFATFPANTETLEWYLRWQLDAMTAATLLPEDLDVEKTVVLNELEQEETNNHSLLFHQARQAAYQTHAYGHSTLGSRTDLQHINAQQIRDFYTQHYQPHNAVLILAGAVDESSTLSLVQNIFGAIPATTLTQSELLKHEAPQEGERRITVRRAGGLPLATALYHAPAGADTETSALILATQMLADRTSGRLNWELVDKGLATHVYGEVLLCKEPGLLAFMAEVAPEKSAYETLTQLHHTIESISEHPFTEQELAHAKRIWLNDWVQLLHDNHYFTSMLSDAIALGDWRLLFQRRDLLENAQLQDIQQVAQRYLIPSNRTEGLYLPSDNVQRPPQAAVPDLDTQLSTYVSAPNALETNKIPTALLEGFEPTLEYIQAHTEIKQLTHPNGQVKIALLPKPSSGQRVQALIQLQFGDAQSLRGKREIASAAVDLLSSGNTETPYQVLENKFAELGSEYTVGGNTSNTMLLFQSHHDALEATLHLAFHVLKTPDYPAEQLTEWKNANISKLSNAMHDPDEMAHMAWNQHHNPSDKNDIYYLPSFQEQIKNIKKISRQDVVKFHDEFYGANNVLVVLVGDFEIEPAVAAIQQELEQWKPGKTFVRIPREHRPAVPIDIMLHSPEKQNAVMIAAQTLPMRASDPDFPALLTATRMLGEPHNSRLWKRIREKEGLSYGIQATLNVAKSHNAASWGIHANYAPQNRAQVQRLIFEEIEKALQHGFTQQELEDAQRSAVQFQRLSLTRDADIARIWMNALSGDQVDLNDEIQLLRHIGALTLDEVNQALKKNVLPKDLVQVYAGDFAPQKTIIANPRKHKSS